MSLNTWTDVGIALWIFTDPQTALVYYSACEHFCVLYNVT